MQLAKKLPDVSSSRLYTFDMDFWDLLFNTFWIVMNKLENIQLSYPVEFSETKSLLYKTIPNLLIYVNKTLFALKGSTLKKYVKSLR